MLIGLAMSLLFERITDAWVFMSSVLASVVFVPVMGGLFLRPRRLAGLCGAAAGLAGLIVFYAMIYWNGAPDDESDSILWTVQGLDLYREYAVLFALPLSAIGFGIGHLFGRR